MESQEQSLEFDFLDEMIAERTRADPAFPVLVEAATRHRAPTAGDGDLPQ